MLVIRRVLRGRVRALEWVLLIPVLLAAVIVVPAFMVLSIVDDVASQYTVSELFNVVIGVALAILFLWLFWWHGRPSVRDRPTRRRGHVAVAAADPAAAEPVAVAVEPTVRGLDWANGAARLGIALALPVLGTVVSLLHPDSTGWWSGPLWTLLPLLGVWFGWEAWLGILRDHELTGDSEGRVLAGRTQWPISRPRSVRLDQLVRVRYLAVFNGRHFSSYLLFVDRLGGRVMVEESDEVTQAARRGLTMSMPIAVGGPTKDRLSGRTMIAFHVTIAGVCLAGAIALAVFGFQVLGSIGAEPQG
jgi:hypothetical protein